MSGTVRSLLAAFTSEGTYTPPNLFAGEQEVITTALTLKASTAVLKNAVLALNASNQLVVLNPDGADATASEAIPVAIAVEAAASGSARLIPVYIAGFFNHEALSWPAHNAVDTLAERQAVFRTSPSNINIGSIPAVRA